MPNQLNVNRIVGEGSEGCDGTDEEGGIVDLSKGGALEISNKISKVNE